jgi:hypothetical protein
VRPADGRTVALETELARSLATSCSSAAEAAGRLADEVGTSLVVAEQSTRAAVLLAEVHDELSLLGRVITGVVDFAEGADRWPFLSTSELAAWIRTLSAQRALWTSLNDGVGTTALEAGVFDLMGSIRTMGAAEWRGATIPPGCESFGPGRYYTGGGMLRGPDDLGYPIVVPHLEVEDGRHYTIDADHDGLRPEVATLGGADPGWQLVGYRTGVARIESDPGRAWALLAGIAVATGLELRTGGDEGQLVGVHMRAGARARFDGGLAPSGSGVPSDPGGGAALTKPEPTVWSTVDGTTAQHPAGDVAGRRPGGDRSRLGRVNTAEQVLSLATGAVVGFVAAGDLRSAGHRAYEVLFETHPDGRRRARLQTFTLEHGPDGPALYGWHLFVGSDGELRQSPISYQLGDSVQPPDLLLASNRHDPDFSTKLPRATFGVSDEPF